MVEQFPEICIKNWIREGLELDRILAAIFCHSLDEEESSELQDYFFLAEMDFTNLILDKNINVITFHETNQ